MRVWEHILPTLVSIGGSFWKCLFFQIIHLEGGGVVGEKGVNVVFVNYSLELSVNLTIDEHFPQL